MRLGDLDALKEMLIKERDAIPLTRTERYSFGVGLPNPHGMSMRGGINRAFRCMEKVPTIDAVPVVRCKDCRYGMQDKIFGHYWCNRQIAAYKVKADDFCSYGKKEGE